jgi:hypothetical protein
MHRTLMLALGAGLFAAVTLPFPSAAVAAKKGSEQGVIAIIKPGETKGVWNPGDKGAGALGGSGNKRKAAKRLPYVEQKHKTK